MEESIDLESIIKNYKTNEKSYRNYEKQVLESIASDNFKFKSNKSIYVLLSDFFEKMYSKRCNNRFFGVLFRKPSSFRRKYNKHFKENNEEFVESMIKESYSKNSVMNCIKNKKDDFLLNLRKAMHENPPTDAWGTLITIYKCTLTDEECPFKCNLDKNQNIIFKLNNIENAKKFVKSIQDNLKAKVKKNKNSYDESVNRKILTEMQAKKEHYFFKSMAEKIEKIIEFIPTKNKSDINLASQCIKTIYQDFFKIETDAPSYWEAMAILKKLQEKLKNQKK